MAVGLIVIAPSDPAGQLGTVISAAGSGMVTTGASNKLISTTFEYSVQNMPEPGVISCLIPLLT